MTRVLTHNSTGYRRGCRCEVCRDDAVRRVREWRARTRKPCDVCSRVHRGRCIPDDVRGGQVNVHLPGRVRRLLYRHVPWGERSRWVAELIERELDRLEEKAA